MTAEALKAFATDTSRYIVEPISNCWHWIGCSTREGYGQVRVQTQRYMAHRLHFEYRFGPIEKGLIAHHLCSRSSCVNPDHIKLVTPAQHRELHKGANIKLSFSAAAEMRRLFAAGEHTRTRLSKTFAVSHATVSGILANKIWACPC